MASTIVTKNSSTASAVPLTGDLTQGELAVNVTDKRLFTKNSGGTVVELGTNPASFALPNGTANGVAYLNGSKVVTTGSALTFDGTNLGVGVSAANYANYKNLAIAGTTGANIDLISGSTIVGNIYNTSTDVVIQNSTSGPMRFSINGSEQMRLTSTGLGIGTSSPAVKLDVRRSGVGDVAYFFNGSDLTTAVVLGAGSDAGYIDTGSIAKLAFRLSGTEVMRLQSGNLGLGVTPSAWWSSTKAIQIGAGGVISGRTDTAARNYFASNAYLNSTPAWTYISTNFATRYEQNDGQHQWFNAPSGTAGNAITFTQAMTLDASGGLQIGRTSVIGTNNRLAIQMSGTSASSYTAASNAAFAIDAGTATNSVINLVGGGDMGIFHSNSSNAYDVGISFGDNSNRILSFTTANAERARIDSSGNLLVGKTSLSDSTNGIQLRSDGAYILGATSSGSECLMLNRNTSDGSIALFKRSNTEIGSISVTTTATAYNTSSDYRLKNIDGPLNGSGDFIDALKPKVGTWKSDGSKFVGFLAHEVQEVSPQTVVGEKDAIDEEGNPIMQAMEYGSAEFIANIVAELQSLRQRVAQLEGK